MIDGPDSSYSALLTHMLLNVERDARIDPPIHTEYLRSGGATTFTFDAAGARAVSSLLTRSAIPLIYYLILINYIKCKSKYKPGNMVVPPERTTLAYNSFLISKSHLWIDSYPVI